MILVDTNILVGFAGRRDSLHRRVVEYFEIIDQKRS